MNKLKYFWAFLIIAAVYPSLLYGEQPVYGWNDIKNIALENNADIYRARENLYQARMRYRSSAAGFWPDISLAASAGIDSEERERHSLSLSAGYDFTLFRGGRRRSELLRSRYRYEAENHRYEAEVRRVIYRLRLAFGEVLRAEENLEVAQETLARVRANLDIVRLRYDAGREDKGALMRSEADTAREDFNLASASRSYRRAVRELFLIAGIRDIPGQAVFEGEFGSVEVPGFDDISGYISSSPEYLSEVYSYMLADEEIESAYGALLPSLNFSASAGRTGTDPVFGDSGWQAGLALRFPFFSSGRDINSLNIARSAGRTASRSLDEKERALYNDIENAWLDVADAAGNLRIVEMYNEATAERGRIAREKYLNGLISYYEWDSIERDRISARNNLTAARSRLYSAAARWELYTGGR